MGSVVPGIIYPKAVREAGRSTAIRRVLAVPRNKLTAGGVRDRAEGASRNRSTHLPCSAPFPGNSWYGEVALAVPQPRPHLCYQKGRAAPALMVRLVPTHRTDPRHLTAVPQGRRCQVSPMKEHQSNNCYRLQIPGIFQ